MVWRSRGVDVDSGGFQDLRSDIAQGPQMKLLLIYRIVYILELHSEIAARFARRNLSVPF